MPVTLYTTHPYCGFLCPNTIFKARFRRVFYFPLIHLSARSKRAFCCLPRVGVYVAPKPAYAGIFLPCIQKPLRAVFLICPPCAGFFISAPERGFFIGNVNDQSSGLIPTMQCYRRRMIDALLIFSPCAWRWRR